MLVCFTYRTGFVNCFFFYRPVALSFAFEQTAADEFPSVFSPNPVIRVYRSIVVLPLSCKTSNLLSAVIRDSAAVSTFQLCRSLFSVFHNTVWSPKLRTTQVIRAESPSLECIGLAVGSCIIGNSAVSSGRADNKDNV